MEKMGKNEKALSIEKLIAAGLINFTVPENTRFVVGELQKGSRHTGFLNAKNQLVGWGLKAYTSGLTIEAMWSAESDIKGVMREISKTSNIVQIKDNYRVVLGRTNLSHGDIKFYVNDYWSSTFNQEAETFANSVYACLLLE